MLNKDWDFSEEVAWLIRKFDQFKKRFFDGMVSPDRPALPVAPIAIDDMRNLRTLAAYNVVPDEYGLNYRLTFNKTHYIDGQSEDGKKQGLALW